MPVRQSVDVDFHLVGNRDVGVVAAKPQLIPEQEQQDQHDNHQQHNGEHSATAATATVNYRHPFFGITVVSHEFTPCNALSLAKRTKLLLAGSTQGDRQIIYRAAVRGRDDWTGAKLGTAL